MAFSLAAAAGFHSSSCTTPLQNHNRVLNKFPRIRSQSFKDDQQGRSADMVDANLSILRKRIDEVKKKEKLMINNTSSNTTTSTTCSTVKNGWNYQHIHDHDHDHQRYKRRSGGHDDIISESMELVGLVSGAIGFVFLSGSLCILLVSFLVTLTSSTN